MNPILTWALQRLHEPSTYAGLTIIAGGLGLHAFLSDHGALIASLETILVAVSGVGLILVKERRTLTASVVLADVANALSQQGTLASSASSSFR